MDKWMNEQRNRKSSHFITLSPIRAAALLPSMKSKEKEEQGKGTADHLMPLGDWLSLFGERGGERLSPPFQLYVHLVVTFVRL